MTKPAARRTIVVLISGRGSNMLSLLRCSRHADSPYVVGAVIADKPDAPGLDAARDLGVEARVIAPTVGEPREVYDGRLAAVVAGYSPALVVLAGFMRILSGAFVDAFAGRVLNIHPSLLPLYPGLHTHRRALAAGDRVHGATVHFVTAELDAGPAVIQARVEVQAGEGEEHLGDRVRTIEHRILPLATRWFCEGRLEWRGGRVNFDGAPLDAPLQLTDIEASKC